MQRVTREEYRARIATLRPIMAVFRGRLECTEVGGTAGNISLRTPHGKELHVGGAVTPDQARAIVEAVNFAIDLCGREARDDGSETRRPGRRPPR
jgi:hypothetical protein